MSLIERARARLPHLRAILVTVLTLAVVLGGLFFWRILKAGQAQEWHQASLPVAAMQLEPRDVPLSLEAIGTLRAVREVELSAEVAGRVSAIRFDSGAEVGAGALLVQLFDGPERADREAAQARAAFARMQVARSEELGPSGAEPRERLEQRRAERDQALAAVRQLNARLVQKQVRAPFAGQIGIRRVNPGQYLNPGDPIATLTDLTRLYVEFALPQQNLGMIRPGATVTVASDAYPQRTFTARVNAVEPRIGEDTRNITVQAILPNPDRSLRPGMYVTASLMLPPQPGALVVPATAIRTSAQGDSVIVIRGKDARKGGKAEFVPVGTGRRIGNNVVIEQGLKPGDVVVTEGQLRVQSGAEVTVARSARAGGR